MATATNLMIDQTILLKAMQIGGFKTKKDTVNSVLGNYVRLQEAEEAFNGLMGIDPWEKGYDYKARRRAEAAKVSRFQREEGLL